MSEDKSEKATPKKKADARKKGQVARSADLNGAVVLLAGLTALSAFGPMILGRLESTTTELLSLVASPELLQGRGDLTRLLGSALLATLIISAPVAVVCAIAGVVVSVAQVGFKPSGQALKPDPKRINPMSGAKQIFGKHAIFETFKSTAKVAVVGSIAALAVFPKLDEVASLTGLPPADLLPLLAKEVLGVAQRAAAGYLFIAAIDFIYQKWKHEKGLRMDKEEVKQEFKQEGLPAEVKSQQRRRAMMMAQGRMMDAVPGADVVVTNPTHYAVALKYSAESPAPVVVAKGQDHMAQRIRERAREAGVTVVPDPPLARALHSSVDVGGMIPEELFHAVASLLAFVYRVAGRRVA
jgi:flagellar biosynthetic protein FlhB